MFCLSENGIIQFTRGDTIEIPITIYDGNAVNYHRYKLKDKDELYFGIMEPNQFFEDAIVRKKCTALDMNEDGDIFITLSPDESEYLLPGLYYYQVKVRLYNSTTNEYSVNTILPKTQLWIEE